MIEQKIDNFLNHLNEEKYKSYLGMNVVYKKPTTNHRPAIWENMLGTVYAMDDNKEIKYFDKNYDEAKKFANLENKKDIRLFKCFKNVRYSDEVEKNPRVGQNVLWVEK